MREAVGYLLLVLCAALLALWAFRPSSGVPVRSGMAEAMSGIATAGATAEAGDERSEKNSTAILSETERRSRLLDALERMAAQDAAGESAGKIASEGSKAPSEGMRGPVDEDGEEGNESNESDEADENITTEEPIRWIGVVPAPPEQEENLSWNDPKDDLYRRIEVIGGEMGDPVFLRLFKEERLLEVWMEVDGEYRFLQRYRLCYYPGTLGPKVSQEDAQVPEGFYSIVPTSLIPQAGGVRAIAVNYPNRYDLEHNRTGGGVRIYGSCSPAMGYGVDARSMEEIYELADTALDNGQRSVSLHLFPFGLSAEKLKPYEGHRWFPFWENLREGYELFNVSRQVPRVWVEEGEYRFGL
jgi:hypothetical protein